MIYRIQKYNWEYVSAQYDSYDNQQRWRFLKHRLLSEFTWPKSFAMTLPKLFRKLSLY